MKDFLSEDKQRRVLRSIQIMDIAFGIDHCYNASGGLPGEFVTPYLAELYALLVIVVSVSCPVWVTLDNEAVALGVSYVPSMAQRLGCAAVTH